MKKLLVILSLCLFVSNLAIAGKKDPAGVLFQVKGNVEYTKNGQKWKKVRRTKFLFSGYQVRSSANSSAKITIKDTGENFNLHSDSVISISNSKLTALQGAVTPAETSGKLMRGLIKKFNKSQAYTTVRRSHKKKDLKIDAVREITLSDKYPYMAWENLGSEYAYRLSIAGKVYDVPASGEMVIRTSVEPFSGVQPYTITAMKDGIAIAVLKEYKSRGKSIDYVATWLADNERDELDKTIADIKATYGEDAFILGSYFEKQNMWVASMDQYKQYLEAYPDEIEMTPYLFRVYKKLKLDSVYKKELEAWKQSMTE